MSNTQDAKIVGADTGVCPYNDVAKARKGE
jgi:hypothetical protein